MAEKKARADPAGNSGGTAKARGRPFRKGESGNPSGRPKLPKDVKEMFKAASADAARLLIDTMNDPEQEIKLRVDCAGRVLERVYGKPTQPIDGELGGEIRFVLAGELEEYAG